MNDFKTNEYLIVHIIESPSPDKLLSKQAEGMAISKALHFMGIKSQYHLAANSATFKTVFLRIIEAHVKPTLTSIPIIHISAHGTPTGLRLTSGELLSWDILEEDVAALNNALDGYLILCISSCKGYYAGFMAANGRIDIPFYAIIGGDGKPCWSETVVGFTTIYHLLGKGKTIEAAVDAARIASGNDDFDIIFATTLKQRWILNELLNVIGKKQE